MLLVTVFMNIDREIIGRKRLYRDVNISVSRVEKP